MAGVRDDPLGKREKEETVRRTFSTILIAVVMATIVVATPAFGQVPTTASCTGQLISALASDNPGAVGQTFREVATEEPGLVGEGISAASKMHEPCL
jgi:hypothetical protein